jgi:cyclase
MIPGPSVNSIISDLFPNMKRLFISLVLLYGSLCRAESTSVPVEVTEVGPNLLVFATSSGNVIASVGEDGVLLIGTPSAASTEEISKIVASRTKALARYVVIWPEDMAHSQGDADWGRRGAFVAMQEKALERLGGHAMGPPMPLPPRLKQLGVDRPRVAFSEVLTFDLNGEAIHVVHQPPGYSDADAIAHFHLANLIYLGEVFPGDGYPEIGTQLGGNLDGLLKTLGAWGGGSFRIVPARGKIASGSDVKTFHDMILNVRDRVQHSIASGESEAQIVAEHPTAQFDARWGHGRIRPDEFVQAIYRVVSTTRTSPK